MRTHRRLVLRKEPLAELATAELESVVAAQAAYLSGGMINCDSLLRPCTRGCGLP